MRMQYRIKTQSHRPLPEGSRGGIAAVKLLDSPLAPTSADGDSTDSNGKVSSADERGSLTPEIDAASGESTAQMTGANIAMTGVVMSILYYPAFMLTQRGQSTKRVPCRKFMCITTSFVVDFNLVTMTSD